MLANLPPSTSRGSATSDQTIAAKPDALAGAKRLLALSVGETVGTNPDRQKSNRSQSASGSQGSVDVTKALSDAGAAKLSRSEDAALRTMRPDLKVKLLERGLTLKQIAQASQEERRQISLSDKTAIKAFMAAGMQVSDAGVLGIAMHGMTPGEIKSLASFISALNKDNEGAINLLKYLNDSDDPTKYLTKFAKLSQSQQNNSLVAYNMGSVTHYTDLTANELCNPEFVAIYLSVPNDGSINSLLVKLRSAREKYLIKKWESSPNLPNTTLVSINGLENLNKADPKILKSLLERGYPLEEIAEISIEAMKKILGMNPALIAWIRSVLKSPLVSSATLNDADIALLLQAKNELHVPLAYDGYISEKDVDKFLGSVAITGGYIFLTTLTGQKLIVSKWLNPENFDALIKKARAQQTATPRDGNET